jgi:DNA-binding SARP family transcriptional activator
MSSSLTVAPAHLFTLGAPRLSGGSGAPFSTRRKALVLLAYLAGRAERPVPREELAALMWGDRTSARARQSLRQVLLELKRALGTGLDVGPVSVTLAGDALALDAAEFDRAIAAGDFEAAVALWGGDFLDGLDDVGSEPCRVWLEAERARLRAGLSLALERLTAAAEARGAWGDAERWAARRAELFPLDETAHRRLVQVLRSGGRAAEAHRTHVAFLARLRAEAEDDPSPQLARLGRQLEQEALPQAGPSRRVAVHTPELVGREHEFAELSAAWEVARDGGAIAVLVEGDQGAGKTRLCEEFLAAKRARRERSVVLRAHGTSSSEPYAAARTLLAQLRDVPELAGASPEALAELRRVAPWVDERFRELPAERGTDDALHEAVANVFAAVGEERLLAMLLDGAEDADAPSRALLVAVARQSPRGVLFVVASARDGAAHDAVVRELATLRALKRVKLRPLSAADVDQMLASILVMPTRERQALAARLHAAGGGNPFYVSELVSTLTDEGWLSTDTRGAWRLARVWPSDAMPIPPAVRAMLERQCARIGAHARRVLDASSVLRTTFDVATVEELTGLPPEAVAKAVDELLARRLIRHAATRHGELEHANELARRVAGAGLAPRAAAELHRRAARAIARRPPLDPAEQELVRYHRRLAGQLDRGASRSSWRDTRHAPLRAAFVFAAAAAAAAPLLRLLAP